jgi:adenylylsulfate kinase-like enzyme
MKKVILIMGHLAAGKTIIAKKLAHNLSLMCFCKDDIKEILVDNIGFKDRAKNLKLSKATFHIMSHIISKMDDHGIIILESNFKYDELEMLKERHQDVLFLSFFITGQVDQLYHRYLERQKTRHIAHKSTGDISYDVFKASMFPYDPMKCLGESICFDTTKNLDVFQLIKDKTKGFVSK